MKIKLRGIYKDYTKDVIDSINEMIYEYPSLKRIVKTIHLKRMKENYMYCFATSRELWGCNLRYEIKLNPKAFAKSNIHFLFSTTSGAYYHSVKSIIYHEIGHCLQLFMPFEKLGLPLKKYNCFNAKKYYETSRDLLEYEYKRYIAIFYDLFNWKECDILRFLGLYAAENPMELLPECFNLYYTLRSFQKRNAIDEERYQFSKAVIEDYKEKYL